MSTRERTKVVIIGAAGRDFHDFNVYWKHQGGCEVVAFTAAQIPDIEGRTYPPELAGPEYPHGIPIEPEARLAELIRARGVGIASMAYSDLPHEAVMHKAAIANAAGADFLLLAPERTMIPAKRPVIAVCAVRTGCGKSQTTRAVARILKERGLKTAAIRHPMPYGDLRKQICQRFAALEDMDRHRCTIEEREEYEPHIRAGNLLFAGIDYQRIVREAEAEADVILWDGGNNDTSFLKANLYIVVADPLRPGHELRYYPGETNARLADVVVINKVESARPEDVVAVEENIRRVNPGARIIRAESPVTVEDPKAIAGRRVLVVEDGPTLTHGEMTIGAAHVAARKHGAAEIIDPRPYAVGSIRDTFAKYTHLTDVLPAMGYGETQMAELEATIGAADCDLVLIGTPIDLGRLLHINKPHMRVRYELSEAATEALRGEVQHCLSDVRPGERRGA